MNALRQYKLSKEEKRAMQAEVSRQARELTEKFALDTDGTNRRKSCDGCKYRRGLGRNGARYKVCNYLIDTGNPRGCPPDRCDKKELRNGERKQKRRKPVPAAVPGKNDSLPQNVSGISQKENPK